MWRTLRIVLVLGIVGTSGSVVHAIDGPCKLATKGDSPVAQACVRGGLKAAKKEMERMAKEAKEKTGSKPDCTSCHSGIDDARYELLKKDGREQFTKLLVTLAAKK